MLGLHTKCHHVKVTFQFWRGTGNSLVWLKRTKKFFASIVRCQILRLDGISGHTHQCCGGGCAPPTWEPRSSLAPPPWTQTASRGSRRAWALTWRRWRCCPAAVTGQTFFSKAGVCTEGWMSGEQLNLQIAFYQIFHRNIDKDMAWLLPLLVDKAGMIKAQIFVLRKDTADILGRKITNGTKTYR